MYSVHYTWDYHEDLPGVVRAVPGFVLLKGVVMASLAGTGVL